MTSQRPEDPFETLLWEIEKSRGYGRRRAPVYARPGVPEAPAWQVLAFLGVLIGAGALGWALFGLVVWVVFR